MREHFEECRSGGTGRRPGLKIPWVVIPVPVRFRSAASNLISEFLVNPVFARGLEIFYYAYGAQMGQTIKFLTPLAVRFAYFLISL